MVIVVTENEPLLVELRDLLRRDAVAKPCERAVLAPRISGLQERIRANVSLRLQEIAPDVSSADGQVRGVAPKKVSPTVLYDDLKRLYREAMALAGDCSRLKRMMREQKKKGGVDCV